MLLIPPFKFQSKENPRKTEILVHLLFALSHQLPPSKTAGKADNELDLPAQRSVGILGEELLGVGNQLRYHDRDMLSDGFFNHSLQGNQSFFNPEELRRKQAK